ncbi:hypothetical protein MPAR168_19435 [Methylorubrum populi]|uniref:Uncharacterized protein n=1 Tax=Methylobacterium radiotolerans TaxID=31998 RepID=A0ABU7T6B4_9HYPH
MGQILPITNDPDRSADLACGLDLGLAYQIHDRWTQAAPVEAAAALVTDGLDPDAVNVQRPRHLLMRARRGAPRIAVLRQDTPQTRLQALALGASWKPTRPTRSFGQ